MSHTRSRTRWTAAALTIAGTAALMPAGAALAAVGTPAAAGQYTYTAKLYIGDEPNSRACSAVLVHANWVLTATSCFAKTPGAAVVAGKPALKTTARIGTTTLDVVNLEPRSDRDVVLARVSKPVTGITPIKLAAAQPAVNAAVTAAGFGRTKTAWVHTKIQTAAFGVASADATTLALTAKGTDALCQGDSGGPLVNSKGELVGINTRSWQGGCLGTPATETRTGAIASRADGLQAWISKTSFHAPGDMTNDGIGDLAAVWGDGSLYIYPGDKAKGLAGTSIAQLGGTTWGSKQLTAGDFNGDGIADLMSVWTDGTLHLYKGDGKGKITDGVTVAEGGNTWAPVKQFTSGDFTGDGIADVMAVWNDGTLHLYKGKGDGQLESEAKVNTGGSTWGTVKLLPGGDFNGDGIADLMAVWNDGTLHYYPGDGTGQIGDQVPVPLGGTTWGTVRHMTAGDFNADGIADLMAVWTDGSLHLYKGDGKGSITDAVTMFGGTTWKTMIHLT
ncbi:FG-GAP-like repeat-containing protein [Streptomyces sp. NBC_01244]|uniref:FG-GAP-like repeat-containing protein n=1 Tax=Streptomyces sp. NBC_01244 TaxID=2903797 RepID=UPI002E0DE0EA|nr:trypsin-like serine protease [Streptomyces sp. NBC_01244]